MCRVIANAKLDTPFENHGPEHDPETAPIAKAGTGFFMPRTVSVYAQGQPGKELPCRNGHRRYRPIHRSFSSRGIEQSRVHQALEQLQSPSRVNSVPAAFTTTAITTSRQDSMYAPQTIRQQPSLEQRTGSNAVDAFSNTDQDSCLTTATTPNATTASLAGCSTLFNQTAVCVSGPDCSSLANPTNPFQSSLVRWVNPASASCELGDLNGTAMGAAITAAAGDSSSMLLNPCNRFLEDSFTSLGDAPWGVMAGISEAINWSEHTATAPAATAALAAGTVPALVPACDPVLPDFVVGTVVSNGMQGVSLASKQQQKLVLATAATAAGSDPPGTSFPMNAVAPSCFVQTQPQLQPAGGMQLQLGNGMFAASTVPVHAAEAGLSSLPRAPGIASLSFECSLLLDELTDFAVIDAAVTNELSQLMQLKQQLIAAASAHSEAATHVPNRTTQCMQPRMDIAAAAAPVPAFSAAATPAMPTMPGRLAYAAQAALWAANCDDKPATCLSAAAMSQALPLVQDGARRIAMHSMQ